MNTENIKSNLQKTKDEINKVITKLNIKREITLIAISKTHPAEYVVSALNEGQIHFGENKVQEAEKKIELVNRLNKKNSKKIKWHLVGHLQSNKAKIAVKLFDMIHSLDKESTIKEVSKRAGHINKIIDILIQVNTTGEESKYGCSPDKVLSLCEKAQELEGVKLRGLMTIGPLGGSEKEVTKSFSDLRKLKEEVSSKLDIPLDVLSMGMSADWRIALREGATHLRIGSLIFGERNYR
ncbi:MAG: YggS family pyridoxal phosphate-dependent enzyme [Spirochaetota bacterium]